VIAGVDVREVDGPGRMPVRMDNDTVSVELDRIRSRPA
jgi:hypothetical protein